MRFRSHREHFLDPYGLKERFSNSSHLLMHHFCCAVAFISHSSSLPQLRFIFEAALPTLLSSFDQCCLVDVGSRLGAVLYGVSAFCKLLYGSLTCSVKAKGISHYKKKKKIIYTQLRARRGYHVIS